MDHYWFASVYDLLLHPFLHRLRKTITKLVKDEKARRVLDVCCGTGNQLKYLKKAGIEGVGVDLSQNMLNISQKGKWKQPCLLEDAAGMPFDEQSFDMGIITLALHEKEPKVAKKIVKEIHRILEPGGRLIVVDYLLDDTCPKIIRSMTYVIERITGKEHYRNFKAYMQSGGLNALHDENDFAIKKTLSYGRNAFTMQIWQKI